MLRFASLAPALIALLSTAACLPVSDEGSGDPLTAVLGETVVADPQDSEPAVATASPPSTAEEPAPSLETSRYSGELRQSGLYELFNLGPGSVGDEWKISPAPFGDGPFVIAIFDARQNLLMRGTLSSRSPVTHVLRTSTANVILGVMPILNTAGGRFEVNAQHRAGVTVPSVAGQIVWLNFGGAQNVRIATRSPISFGAFDAGEAGAAYSEFNEDIKARIVELMQADYAAYDVEIRTSDDGPAPAEPYSTVHFGGDVSGLLGLADNVDNYNTDPSQEAVVYVGTFSIYESMQLAPEELAVMLANVASHELGHLLGLYHTQDVNDVMDTTGSAWDLVEDQVFARARLEESVFAVGASDSPALLMQTVGPNPAPAKRAAWKSAADAGTVRLLRSFAAADLQSMCGTCRNLDPIEPVDDSQYP